MVQCVAWSLDNLTNRTEHFMGSRRHKLAFIGTTCTGKTTLLETFHADPRIAVVPEAAREYFSSHTVDIANRYSAAVQGALQELIIEQEKTTERLNRPILLCDRSVLDAVVYTDFGGDSRGADSLFVKAKPLIRTYERFWILDPAGIPHIQDLVRIEDETTRQLIHERFIRFLSERDIPFELLSGSRQERVDRVRWWIERCAMSPDGTASER